MARYLISYDLDKPGPQNYARLEQRLQELHAVRLLYSQWFLNSPLASNALEQDFMQYIDPKTDSFLVVEITPGRTTWNNLRISDEQFRALL